MSEPHIKAIPHDDKLHFVMDRAGYELFERIIKRSEPARKDNPKAFTDVKHRIEGALFAGAVVMGWSEK
jgi:hypothetical protein